MTIEQIRAALKDVNAEINQARDEAMQLQANKDAGADAMKAATDKLASLKARRDMLKESLDEETEAQSANLKAFKANSDAVKAAASKFKSAGDFYSAVARAKDFSSRADVDPRLGEYVQVRSASGQNLTTDTEGGVLVPPDYSEELVNVAKSESVLFGKVNRVPVSGNRLITNVVDTESRKDYVDGTGDEHTGRVKGRNGGLLAYWTAEAAQYTASRMRFKQDQIDLHKLTGMCYATEEMLEDLPAMAGIINEGFRDEFAFKIDDAIFDGSGSGMPAGILGSAALVTIAKESGQAAATLELNNILKMFNAMPAKNRANAEWYINQDLELVLMQLLMNVGRTESTDLTVINGVPVFLPAGQLASAPNGMLLGRPLVPIEQAKALGAKGDIVFADLSQYRWIDKGAMNGQTSIHVRFEYDETAFKFTYRAGGKTRWLNPIEAYNGSTVRSPFVALAARS